MRKHSILACPLRLRMILALAFLSWVGSGASRAEETKTQSSSSAAGSKTTEAKPVTPVLKTLVDLLTGSSSKSQTTTTTTEFPGVSDSAAASTSGSHRQSKAIKVEGSDGAGALKTMCLHTNGNILAIVGESDYRRDGSKPAKSSSTSEIRVYDPNGEPLKSWSVPFPAQAINVSPSGEVFVAGDGRIAKFDSKGKLLSEAAMPHVEELMKNADALREQAKERRDAILKSYEQQLSSLQIRKDQLTKKKSDGKDNKDKKSATKEPAADAEDSVELFLGGGNEEQQLRSLNSMIRSYESALTDVKKRTVDDYTTELTSRLRKANALAVSDKEIFLACGQIKGYGYSLWRMTHSFKEPKEIVSGLGGCCGQMDVQCCKDELIVAENTRHHVVRFDRDGKKLGTFGSRSRSGDGSGFGGCCNPMNTRPGPNGDVFTAESEGVVKRFSASGKFVGSVGSVQLSGGCKNVAVAVSPDGKRVYFCDLPGSRILVLDEKKSEGAAQLQ